MENSTYFNNPHMNDDLKMAITEYIRIVNHAILNKLFVIILTHSLAC